MHDNSKGRAPALPQLVEKVRFPNKAPFEKGSWHAEGVTEGLEKLVKS